MESLLQDMRYAARMLVKKPGFTVAAIVTLAIGIGLNTAIFSVVNSILLRPLPYKAPERLVQVWETFADDATSNASPNNFLDWSKQSESFEHLAAVQLWLYSLTGVSEPTEVTGMKVSTSFFSVLGAGPQLGRTFSPDDDQPDKSNSVVISHALWQRDFGGDSDVLGKAIKLDDASFTIIGVMKPDFRKADISGDYQAELWTPMPINAGSNLRGSHYLRVIGRLKDGITLEQAQSEMNAIAGQLEQSYPATNTGRGVNIVALHEQITGNVRLILILLQCATALVLLIACANVANLLLARVAAREREMAIRSALGSGRARLVRLLLTESLLLAVIGGALGLLLAIWGIDFLVAIAPSDIPRLEEISLDGRALGFMVALSLLTVCFFGLIPAWQAAKVNINEALKESSRAATRGQGLRGALIVIEVALTLVLLVGAGLLVRSLNHLQSVKLGFNPENVLTMRVSLIDSKYKERGQVGNYYQQALDRIKTLPGVRAAAITLSLPMVKINNMTTSFDIEGQPAEAGREPTAGYRVISPDYFRAMQIAMVKGREFDERDVRGATAVVIVNEQFVNRYLGGVDPIGRKLTVNRALREIIGVVSDVHHQGLDLDEDAGMYIPHAQNSWGSMMLVVRADSAPERLAAPVSKIIWESDPEAAVSRVATMDKVLSDVVSRPRFNTLLLSLFSIVALVLASIGIYSVVSYTVAQSTREIGIRMALGAQSLDVLKLIMGQGFVLSVIGIGLGVAGGLGLTQLIKKLLFGVEATDPFTFASVSLLLIVVVMLACYVPARRATQVDPMVALRYE